MDYYQISGSRQAGTQLVFDPEDWPKNQWDTITQIFDCAEAECIILSDYVAEIYGTPKVPAYAEEPTSFQQDLAYFVSDMTYAQAKAMYEQLGERIKYWESKPELLQYRYGKV